LFYCITYFKLVKKTPHAVAPVVLLQITDELTLDLACETRQDVFKIDASKKMKLQ